MKKFTASQTIYEILEDNGIVLYTSEDMAVHVTPEQEQEIRNILKALDIEDDWFFEE